MAVKRGKKEGDYIIYLALFATVVVFISVHYYALGHKDSIKNIKICVICHEIPLLDQYMPVPYTPAINNGLEVGCVNCHRDSYQEFVESSHYNSSIPLRPGCTSCHGAVHSVSEFIYLKFLPGGRSHPLLNKYDPLLGEKRFELRLKYAKEEREKLVESDSNPCRRCHLDKVIKPEKIQGQNAHEKMKTQKKTCIDCHYNIVHRKFPWSEKEKAAKELEGLF
ncbi:MAG: NapC/NirT family cytochrome c [Deltaproteobacteria bacterium]|nr:NapC/NirT family cytochrome c [Deltaproteobacteria bacterium]